LLALCNISGAVSEWIQLGVGFGREVKGDIGELEARGFDKVTSLAVVC
jgi:hypothetical protein